MTTFANNNSTNCINARIRIAQRAPTQETVDVPRPPDTKALR